MIQPEVRESLRRFIKMQAVGKDITIGEYITTVFLAHTDYELPVPVKKLNGIGVKDSK